MYICWAIPTQLKCLYFSLQSGAFKMIITMVRMCKCIFKCSNTFSLMKIIFQILLNIVPKGLIVMSILIQEMD